MDAISRDSQPEMLGSRLSRSYGILSTYPPTACGLATFSAALGRGLVANGAAVGIVRVSDKSGEYPHDPVVLSELHEQAPASLHDAVATLNQFDVAIVQHEYGIYGGTDGEEVIEIIRSLKVPSITVAHTVLKTPSHHQQHVLEAVVDASNSVVVMSEAAKVRLQANFRVDPSKIVKIPHGATLSSANSHDRVRPSPHSPTLLTWGLLGPGKGVEWAIDAVALLQDLIPRPRLVIAGRTHPKVVAKAGESYREMLVARAAKAGITSQVVFDSTYRDLPSLIRLIQSATLVVLPYDSSEQATSGVLVDAIAAGRPVVATEFPHAIELLSSGAGLVVPSRDPDSLANALRKALTCPVLMASMEVEAARIAPNLSWVNIAGRYDELASDMLAMQTAPSR